MNAVRVPTTTAVTAAGMQVHALALGIAATGESHGRSHRSDLSVSQRREHNQ